MTYDLIISGAGPVGLLSAYLAMKSGLKIMIIDKSSEPLKRGRADALNARTLQFLELAGLFNEIYPLGLPCKTSSIFKQGKFVSRQSDWWDRLEGCYHKHFLMLGQAKIEKILNQKVVVKRKVELHDIKIENDLCECTLSNGESLRSRFVLGADGARSFIRNHFNISFPLNRPEIIWAVLDAEFETNFPMNPEIVVFQNETSDVAKIPREGSLERFYIRMDKKNFGENEVLSKIRNAIAPYEINIKRTSWFSQFSVKESVAESYSVKNKVFLAGDACHVHSVNGGQGLNTGLADAVNLIWKIQMKINFDIDLLNTYESERIPVAKSVIESSGALVRATKFSQNGTHADDYMRIVEERAGNITGMGIHYNEKRRLLDFKVGSTRIYSLLDYSKYTLLTSADVKLEKIPEYIQIIKMNETSPYFGKTVLVRPDSYIQKVFDQDEKIMLCVD